MMRKFIGYLVEKDGKVIGATGNEREALYIARSNKAISYKVVTTIRPYEEPITERIVAYDGTI